MGELGRRDALKKLFGVAAGVSLAAVTSDSVAAKQVNPEAEPVKRTLKPENLIGEEFWKPGVYFSKWVDDGSGWGFKKYSQALTGTSVRQMNGTIVGTCAAVEINEGLFKDVDYDAVRVDYANNGNKTDAQKYPDNYGQMVLSRSEFMDLIQDRDAGYRSAFMVITNGGRGEKDYNNVFSFGKTEIPPTHPIGTGGVEVTFLKRGTRNVQTAEGTSLGGSTELKQVLQFWAHDMAGRVG